MMKLSSFNWIYLTLEFMADHQIYMDIILLFTDCILELRLYPFVILTYTKLQILGSDMDLHFVIR